MGLGGKIKRTEHIFLPPHSSVYIHTTMMIQQKERPQEGVEKSLGKLSFLCEF